MIWIGSIMYFDAKKALGTSYCRLIEKMASRMASISTRPIVIAAIMTHL